MSRLDPELATALAALERGFGPLKVLQVHTTPPERRPATPPPAPAGVGLDQPNLFDPTHAPEPVTDPLAQPLSPAPSSTRRTAP